MTTSCATLSSLRLLSWCCSSRFLRKARARTGANATRWRILVASVVRGRYRVYPSSVRNAAIASASAVSCARLGRGEGRASPERERRRRRIRIPRVDSSASATTTAPGRFALAGTSTDAVRHLVHDRARSVFPSPVPTPRPFPAGSFPARRDTRDRLESVFSSSGTRALPRRCADRRARARQREPRRAGTDPCIGRRARPSMTRRLRRPWRTQRVRRTWCRSHRQQPGDDGVPRERAKIVPAVLACCIDVGSVSTGVVGVA